MRKKTSDFAKVIKLDVDTKLLKEALTHRSYNNDQSKGPRIHNERLEFLGDAVLEILVTEYLFNHYPKDNEGRLTSLRAAVVRTESLAEEAERLEYGEYLYMSKGEELTGGRQRPYILANSFEAIVGAIYLDKGLEVTREFLVRELFYKIPEIISKNLNTDSKSKLQEVSQGQVNQTPIYEVISAKGPDHDKVFKVRVVIDRTRCGMGRGASKQKAQQEAAKKTLENWEKYKKKILRK